MIARGTPSALSLKSDPRLCGACPLRHSTDNVRAASEQWQGFLLVRSVDRNCVLHVETSGSRLITVRQGMLKVESNCVGGDSQVLGFLVPGESVLLSPMRRSSLAVTAVDASTICEVDIEAARDVLPDAAAFFEWLAVSSVVQSEFVGRPHWIAAPAPLRLKSFLRDLGARQGNAGGVVLPMSREDLANHLAMRPETLSRAIATLVRHNEIRLTSTHSVSLEDR